MVTANSRATCSTQSFPKQNTLCVIPSPLTGDTYKITVRPATYFCGWARKGAWPGGRVHNWEYWGGQQVLSTIHLAFWVRVSWPGTCCLGWCGLTISPFSVFAFPVLRLQESTIILGFLQVSWGQTLGSHACIANFSQTELSLFEAPSPHLLDWFYLAFFLLRLSAYHVSTSSLSSAVYRHAVCCTLTGNNGNEFSRREYS